MSDDKCPGCGAGFSAKPVNRNGWYYGLCGRRYHRERDEWESYKPPTCLHRQLVQAKSQLAECKRKTLLEAAEKLGKVAERSSDIANTGLGEIKWNISDHDRAAHVACRDVCRGLERDFRRMAEEPT